jgi:hypothetical protein
LPIGWAVKRIAAKKGIKRRIDNIGSVDYTTWKTVRI